jgi:hypothetical protein
MLVLRRAAAAVGDARSSLVEVLGYMRAADGLPARTLVLVK